ncbi:hypothetical protein GH865_02745 [Rhodocyclus tenuis]|uniref:hypothetical protein n=1 Tax=Rhodocyclus gracilis TaxID=2929842 RepID=UPI001298B763|nr:hypothetical protein [Rhodocyclus gracilis]MRD72168.1 hypothetical protein [Rhodocyclus gracilis]
MDRLVSYVSAIHALSSPVAIVRQTQTAESWLDQGFEVRKETHTYCFDNGVIVRKTVEQDAFPSAAACAECWISYEVLGDSAAAMAIVPARQSFASTCRESFWLSYHRA